MDTTNASSSSSSPPSRWDVFLSFYGKDTYANFTDHLYVALGRAEILTFRYDPALEKGEEIKAVEAIEESKKFVVVLSENYAYSPWCLNELVEILSCKRRNGKVVIPVFYYVNPSDVRHQKASFGKALDGHKKRYSDDTMDKWKSALAEIGETSGYHLSKDTNQTETDIILKIVEDVAPSKVLHLEEDVFGIDSAVEAIHLKLKMESNDVRAIVIWGMGGIGKTTTAKAFFNKYYSKFDVSCFIGDAKEYTLLSLLQQLLTELLRMKDYMVPDLESGINILQRILRSKKALIILDDLEQLELLGKLSNLFSPGSRIIVTTRNASLQNGLKVHISEVDLYEVKGLGENESLELFSYHAFHKLVPPESFKELSKEFVSYAGGLPLALKVVGSSLFSKPEVSLWKAELERVRKIPHKEIQNVLQVAYDGLDNETLKVIFLDIAFFFVGKDKDQAVRIFNSCGFFPDAGIPDLVKRSLLTIDKKNKFQMHKLIQDMGLEVGKSRGLFWQGNGNEWEDLHYSEGTDKIEGLVVDLTMSTERQMSAKIFERLPNLRLLEIIGALDIKGNFKNCFRKLRYIRWPSCPWTRLPSDFRPLKLVSLDMPGSKFKILWKDAILWKSIQQLTNLAHLDLSSCLSLKRLPEQLGDMKGLKMLDASDSGIEKLPDSIAELKELVELKLDWCKKLTSLPNSVWKLKLLKVLHLGYCGNLERLPEQLGEMQCLEVLDASGTSIEELPDSIVLLSSLQKLKLKFCWKLKKLPEQLGMMQGLKVLDLFNSSIEELPDSIELLSNLEKLNLGECWKLEYLPKNLRNLRSFQLYYFKAYSNGKFVTFSMPIT